MTLESRKDLRKNLLVEHFRKWIIRDRLFEKHYECSACGAEFNGIYDKCPNCKAKMDTKQLYDPRFMDELEFLDMMGL